MPSPRKSTARPVDQTPPQQQPDTFTDEEAQLAASQEEQERLTRENDGLKQRVVLLRAMVNRQQKQLAEFPTVKQPEDHKPPARKPAAKKAAASRKQSATP